MKRLLLVWAVISSFAAESQNLFDGATWNYHIYSWIPKPDPDEPFDEYYYYATFRTIGDTTIKLQKFKIIDGGRLGRCYLKESNGLVHYFFRNEIYRLFDFSAHVGDTIDIDLFQGANSGDTVLTGVLVRIDSLSYVYNTTQTDSLRELHYSFVNADDYDPSFGLSHALPKSVVEWMIVRRMGNYHSKSLFDIFNSFLNLGSESKPELSCYRNDSTGFQYMDTGHYNNGYSCTYTTGLKGIGNRLTARIYPNPAINKIRVELPDEAVKGIGYEIYDLSGKSCIHGTLEAGTEEIELNALHSGMYFLRLKQTRGSASWSGTFVKE